MTPDEGSPTVKPLPGAPQLILKNLTEDVNYNVVFNLGECPLILD